MDFFMNNIVPPDDDPTLDPTERGRRHLRMVFENLLKWLEAELENFQKLKNESAEMEKKGTSNNEEKQSEVNMVSNSKELQQKLIEGRPSRNDFFGEKISSKKLIGENTTEDKLPEENMTGGLTPREQCPERQLYIEKLHRDKLSEEQLAGEIQLGGQLPGEKLANRQLPEEKVVKVKMSDEQTPRKKGLLEGKLPKRQSSEGETLSEEEKNKEPQFKYLQLNYLKRKELERRDLLNIELPKEMFFKMNPSNSKICTEVSLKSALPMQMPRKKISMKFSPHERFSCKEWFHTELSYKTKQNEAKYNENIQDQTQLIEATKQNEAKQNEKKTRDVKESFTWQTKANGIGAKDNNAKLTWESFIEQIRNVKMPSGGCQKEERQNNEEPNKKIEENKSAQETE